MDNEKEKTNYYAILPANVRYDKTLSANAKILYAEITCLCNEKGFCWATNKHFADVYDVTERSVTNWIYELYSKGYIDCTKQYDNKDSTYYGYRKISIEGGRKNFLGGVEKNFYQNNIYNNKNKKKIDNNKLLSIKEKEKVPTLEEIKNYCVNVRHNKVDYQYFYDYFTTGNWVDSEGKKVKNWKQKIITWEKNKNNQIKEHKQLNEAIVPDWLKEETKEYDYDEETKRLAREIEGT